MRTCDLSYGSGDQPLGGHGVHLVDHSPGVGVAELRAGKPFCRHEVLEVFTPNPSGVRVQVGDMKFDLTGGVVDADWSCCVCHVLSVERGTDIFGSIGGRVRI